MTAIEFHAAPLTDEETEALAWLDAEMASDLAARIRRYDHRWTLSLHNVRDTATKMGSYFVGGENETLRALILHAYRTAVNTCAGCGQVGLDNNGAEHVCPAE